MELRFIPKRRNLQISERTINSKHVLLPFIFIQIFIHIVGRYVVQLLNDDNVIATEISYGFAIHLTITNYLRLIEEISMRDQRGRNIYPEEVHQVGTSSHTLLQIPSPAHDGEVNNNLDTLESALEKEVKDFYVHCDYLDIRRVGLSQIDTKNVGNCADGFGECRCILITTLEDASIEIYPIVQNRFFFYSATMFEEILYITYSVRSTT